jgi:hypothetical protein
VGRLRLDSCDAHIQVSRRLFWAHHPAGYMRITRKGLQEAAGLALRRPNPEDRTTRVPAPRPATHPDSHLSIGVGEGVAIPQSGQHAGNTPHRNRPKHASRIEGANTHGSSVTEARRACGCHLVMKGSPVRVRASASRKSPAQTSFVSAARDGSRRRGQRGGQRSLAREGSLSSVQGSLDSLGGGGGAAPKHVGCHPPKQVGAQAKFR